MSKEMRNYPQGGNSIGQAVQSYPYTQALNRLLTLFTTWLWCYKIYVLSAALWQLQFELSWFIASLRNHFDIMYVGKCDI